jgi:phytoene/squalene synthetase
MDAASLLQIIETILAMHKDLMAHIEAGSSYLPLSDRDDKYNNLEKVLQKYEQEIRNHIRVEQQLKIYTDSMQETLEEREKKIKQLTEQNITMTKHLEKKLEEAQQENTRLKSRLQTQNSAPRSSI